MASTPKTGNRSSRTSSVRNKKPATIDLEAKETGQSGSAEGKDKTQKAVTGAKAAGSSSSAAEKTGSGGKTASTAKASAGSKPEETKTAKASEKPAASEKPVEKKSSDNKTPPPPPAQAAAKKGGGGFTSAIMGAALAVVGLGAVGQVEGAKDIPLIGALYGGGDGSAASSATDSAQIDELKQQIAALSAGDGATDLAPLEQKIAALEEQLAALPAGGGDSAGGEELTQRFEALEGSIKALEARPVAVEGDGTVNLAPIQNQIDELSSKLAAIEENLASAATSEDLAAVSGALPEVTTSINTLSETVTGLVKKTDDLKLIVDDSAEGLAALNSQSQELTETVASVKASEKIARSVAVTALSTAIENDDPLVQPINSLKALMGETEETKRLEELVAEGIPTRKALVTNLDAFTNSVKDPAAPGEDASLGDKFWANAQKLVTFRSTGPREGDDVFAILSRVRANVDDDNLQGAKSEWAKLPAEIQEQGANWLAGLDTRIETFALQAAISEKLTAEAG